MSDNVKSVKINSVTFKSSIPSKSIEIDLHSHDKSTDSLFKMAKEQYNKIKNDD